MMAAATRALLSMWGGGGWRNNIRSALTPRSEGTSEGTRTIALVLPLLAADQEAVARREVHEDVAEEGVRYLRGLAAGEHKVDRKRVLNNARRHLRGEL